MDFGSFFLQVLPIAIFYLIVPAALLMLFFGVRQVRRRMNSNTAAQGATTTNHKTAISAADDDPLMRDMTSHDMTSHDVSPRDETPWEAEDHEQTPKKTRSTLELLAQAQSEEDYEEESDIDMPDIAALLGNLDPDPEPPAKATPAPRGRIPMHSGGSVQAHPIVTVMRDEDSGRLLVEIDGQGYYTLTDTPEAKKLFKAIMKELSNVIMTPLEEQPAPKAAVAEDALLEELRTSTASAPKPPTSEFVPPPPVDTGGAMPGDLPSYKMDDVEVKIESRGAFRKAKVSIETPPELDIAGAINAYLQHKLRYTPEMDGNTIGILPSMSGGVRIMVNGKGYEAVDEIDELDVRSFVQQSIAEWQERQ
ncbi:hypothetical protein G4Y79_19540 [Phototrophicus methaneseepsis]|uniref:Uncharacterized protein n=1 Tax=Phototrophicus methaneseepsis TaxID=2710758 RepID=A0A7S8E7P2_9CHLR|nr:hypothetical protein [Phototrophicus methaneseepsis]QPC81860.1 hypothetical protein G4Y79_19540 [Phototrophicus methaneseepsis]